MTTLRKYAEQLVAVGGKTLRSGDVFAKVLTANDDSSKHGVLIPNDAYGFFPTLPTPNPQENARTQFTAVDVLSKKSKNLSYIYYQKYPERRITRVNALINERLSEPRIIVVLHARHSDETSGYYIDCANSAAGGRFNELFGNCFGDEIQPAPGLFVTRPVDSGVFTADTILTDLLTGFDHISAQGWIDSRREGDTGIGYTFESLLGIKENNEKTADFRGIEIKCKGIKEGMTSGQGKINLFQQGPMWLEKMTAKERIRQIGIRGNDRLYACHSQITTRANNLGLKLAIAETDKRIDLRKKSNALGCWSFEMLNKRLQEKHARAVFVKAASRKAASKTQFHYEELVYCERPSIERFVNLVEDRNIVFEFLMSEKSDGTVRNHGYPWRLVRQEFLDQLFTFQIKLR